MAAADENMSQALSALSENEEEIIDAFCGDLRFGTSGIRGILGPGTNRMNEYVVRRATFGLARYLKKNFESPSVVIAYDTRKNSRFFAWETAKVLRGCGIAVYLFDKLATVSLLSFAIREIGCTTGVMITASHNPKVFNGYKVYGSDGYQIVGSAPEEILAEIDNLDYFDAVPSSEEGIKSVDEAVSEGFIRRIIDMAPVENTQEAKGILNALKVVYTPLNGTGNTYVRRVLSGIGFHNLVVVPCQEQPDENFSTCPAPNPEKITAFTEGFKTMDETGGDIIIATDPDCDRVGVSVYHDGMKVLLTGNQLGVLMLDYLCQVRPPKKGQFIAKSIVTTPLADRIAHRHGLTVKNTLTGFKYIGEIIANLGEEGAESSYYFAFEESNGYLAQPFIRDKDGVSSAMLSVCLAAHYKAQGKDLIQRLREIYTEYGACYDKTRNFFFEGPYGKLAMSKVMTYFREEVTDNLCGYPVREKIDYMNQSDLPKADVVSFMLEDSTTVVVRPSGTEPKIKVYFFESGNSRQLEKALKDTVESFKTA